MIKLRKGAALDTRFRCPFCGMRTWERDYARFMRDHDRADGKKCKRAARQQAMTTNTKGSRAARKT